MKKIIAAIVFALGIVPVQAQTTILPDGKSFDPKWFKNEKYQMDCYLDVAGQKTKFGTFDIEVKLNGSTLSVFTSLQVPGSNMIYTDTCIADAVKLKPVYRSSYSKEKNYALHFGTEITGYYLDKGTGRKTVVKGPAPAHVFDSYLYPYVLGSLPFGPGFKAKFSGYDYKPGSADQVADVKINGVESAIFKSKTLGDRNVWKVNIVEEATQSNHSYYIDKESRKLWKAEFSSGNNEMEYVVNELELGNASITGQVFARDNQNEGLGKGIAIINVNKKQFAPVGTIIYLIPGTPYFEKFRESVKRQRKSKSAPKAEPLSEEFLKTVRSTSVMDEKGNYELKNVPEGTYYLTVSFGYEHTHIGTETIGQTNYYINGNYQGSSPITRIYAEGQNGYADIEKKITIEPDQKKLKQDLKKTL